MVHVSHLKQIFPADIIIDKIPDYSTFGRKTKLAIHPDQNPDLGWHCAVTLNTPTGEKSSLPSLRKRGGELRARKRSKDRWTSLELEAIKTPLLNLLNPWKDRIQITTDRFYEEKSGKIHMSG